MKGGGENKNYSFMIVATAVGKVLFVCKIIEASLLWNNYGGSLLDTSSKGHHERGKKINKGDILYFISTSFAIFMCFVINRWKMLNVSV